jgi:hypothetical protein
MEKGLIHIDYGKVGRKPLPTRGKGAVADPRSTDELLGCFEGMSESREGDEGSKNNYFDFRRIYYRLLLIYKDTGIGLL